MPQQVIQLLNLLLIQQDTLVLLLLKGVGIHGSTYVNGNINVTSDLSATTGNTNLRNLDVSGNRNISVSNDGVYLILIQPL